MGSIDDDYVPAMMMDLPGYGTIRPRTIDVLLNMGLYIYTRIYVYIFLFKIRPDISSVWGDELEWWSDGRTVLLHQSL
jgi:hypothetical protein